MLKIKGNYFIIETDHTAMIVKGEGETASLAYYGKKLSDYTGLELLGGVERKLFTTFGGVDFRAPDVEIAYADGSFSSRFVFRKGRIAQRANIAPMPSAYGEEKSLLLEFTEETQKMRLQIYLTAFSNADVITSNFVLTNQGKKPVLLKKVPSLVLECRGEDFDFVTFDGAWGCEREKTVHPVRRGKVENSAYTGSSSPFHNPFVMMERKGEVYGVNLIYSGNHQTTVEGAFNKTRLTSGINPFAFSWELGVGESFASPECALTYAVDELGISANMHKFTSSHIVRKNWAKRPRPVLVNNWEGTYFNFNRQKLLDIARASKEVGAELFVLDDGWFGERDDDTSSLGDWYDYEKKTGGLATLAEDVRSMGLGFGIWMEPEMVSEKSELYRKHPEYCMKIPRREPTRMRNQLMLDLSDPQVQGFVYRAVSRVLTETKACYLKWDYNRFMTDCFGRTTSGGEYYHRYILGLYTVLSKLVGRFPNVLFEGCASGGGRFDLGMLAFTPQIWTSDNTDARDRVSIQSGTAYAYPQSCISAHVSVSPNEQTFNANSLDARFRVATGGVLGYELDTSTLAKEDKEKIKAQIAFYKENRELFQFGKYTRMGDPSGAWSGFTVFDSEMGTGVSVVCVFERKIGKCAPSIAFKGLDEKAIYRVTLLAEREIYLGEVSGELLASGEFDLEGIYAETDARVYSRPLYTRMYRFENTVLTNRKKGRIMKEKGEIKR